VSKKKSASEKNDSGNGVADVRTAYFNFLQENMPRNWSTANMGELCEIQTGKLDVNQADDDGKYPFFTCAEKIYRINTAAFDTEAVLVAGNGFFNVKYYKGKFNAYQRTYVLSDIGIDGKYLYHYIDCRLSDITKNNRGSTIRYIRLGDLRDYPVAVAPDKEQSRIVAEIEKQFSRLDEAVDNLKRVKANLKRYKASVLKAAVEGKLTEEWRKKHPDVEPADKLLERILAERRKKWEEAELAKMKKAGKVPKDDKWKKKYKPPVPLDTEHLPVVPVSWVWTTLDQVGQETRPILYGIIKPGPHIPDGVPYVRVMEMKDGHIDVSILKRTSPERAAKFARATLMEGDILISKDGTIGRVAIVPPELEGGNITQHVMRAPSHVYVNNYYIAWAIRSPICQRWLSGETKGVALRGVNVEDFRRLPIPVPPVKEQNKIIDEIEHRMSIIGIIDEEIEKNILRAERLRQSILKKAFSGKLVPQDADNESAVTLLKKTG